MRRSHRLLTPGLGDSTSQKLEKELQGKTNRTKERKTKNMRAEFLLDLFCSRRAAKFDTI